MHLTHKGGWPILSRFETSAAPPLSRPLLERQGGNTISPMAAKPKRSSLILRPCSVRVHNQKVPTLSHKTRQGWRNQSLFSYGLKGWASPLQGKESSRSV